MSSQCMAKKARAMPQYRYDCVTPVTFSSTSSFCRMVSSLSRSHAGSSGEKSEPTMQPPVSQQLTRALVDFGLHAVAISMRNLRVCTDPSQLTGMPSTDGAPLVRSHAALNHSPSTSVMHSSDGLRKGSVGAQGKHRDRQW